MYAVVETGGKQIRVKQGDVVEVELIPGKAGDEVVLGKVLMVSDGDAVTVGTPSLEATVRARILGEAKGPKVNGMNYKRRKNFRQRYGHRQKYTAVEIIAIEA